MKAAAATSGRSRLSRCHTTHHGHTWWDCPLSLRCTATTGAMYGAWVGWRWGVVVWNMCALAGALCLRGWQSALQQHLSQFLQGGQGIGLPVTVAACCGNLLLRCWQLQIRLAHAMRRLFLKGGTAKVSMEEVRANGGHLIWRSQPWSHCSLRPTCVCDAGCRSDDPADSSWWIPLPIRLPVRAGPHVAAGRAAFCVLPQPVLAFFTWPGQARHFCKTLQSGICFQILPVMQRPALKGGAWWTQRAFAL